MAELTVTPVPTGPDAPNTPAVNQPPPPAVNQPPPAVNREPPPVNQPPPAVNQPPPAAVNQQETPPQGINDESVSNFVKDAGFDPQALAKEIVSTGTISQEARKTLGERLEKAGLSQNLIDFYIEGQRAAADNMVRDVLSVAGGREGFNEMSTWAQANLSTQELDAFNKVMTTADAATAKLMMSTMYARFRAAVPANGGGNRVRGNNLSGISGGDVFRSFEEQVAAQQNPLYASDPGYREEVEQKIERTLKAGGYRYQTR